MTLAKAYLAKKYENKIYQKWEKSGIFTPKVSATKKPFTIVMPPPNATGTLHLGHATMLAIEDIMIRFRRMQGYAALWLPGTDHAGIATQNRVEKDIYQKEKLTRHNLGRKEFLKRVKKFVAESQDTIRNQIRKMGSSCDWTRERYTLDKDLSHAVKTVFVKMYKDGLIYRGDRIVNWCIRCSSTLADDEVNYREEKTKFYYFKYGQFVIGTVRPETKFLDKVIVVHPDDKRYAKFIGQKFMVPWIEGDVEARILGDSSVDPSFGTGVMTITPAHDFKDFEIAKRYNIEIIAIIDEKGNLTKSAGEFFGLNARLAREKIVQKLQEKGLVEKIEENYLHNLPLCYRCSTPIEPLVSKQWFVNVNKPIIKQGKKLLTIKEKAIAVVKKGDIKIIPERFKKTYFHWMDNLRDWCISRQIWFGHRIPVYYCRNEKCGNIIVQIKKPQKCLRCKKTNYRQDPDTLDTWFSSGIWTFSTLGWPKNTADLKYFHPTSVLETGYDILFFWIARMIIMTTYIVGQIPFENVYLHGLIRDRYGCKMSKSRPETCIDPLDMIEKYGADALRLSMVIGATPGNDLRLYEEKIAGYRNFVNKIFNACRFALMNISKEDILKIKKIDPQSLSISDKWILSCTQRLIKDVTQKLENYEFSEAGSQIYDFTWGTYCNWYLEFSKSRKNSAVLLEVLKTILKLLHPFIPFVTETLWNELKEDQMLIAGSWPTLNKTFLFPKEETEVTLVTEIISTIRSLRAESNILATKKMRAAIYGHNHTKIITDMQEYIKKLAHLEGLQIKQTGQKVKKSLSCFVGNVEIYLPVTEILDIDKEKTRLEKEIVEKEKFLDLIMKKLENPHFNKKAPREIIEKERVKAQDCVERIKKMKKQLEILSSA